MVVADASTDVVGGAAAPPEIVTRKPPGAVKFFYSLGQVIESGYLAANGFVFFYYTAVLGMSGGMVGLALAISLALDAAADPLIGAWTDNVRSRLGRRLPVMLIGAPLTMLTMGLLFAPPSGLSALLLFVWLTVFKMSFRAFASVYNIPYFALGAELTDGYIERAKIVAQRLFSGIIVTVLITAAAYSVFFAGEGGLQQPDRYPAFGWSIGGFMLIGGLICCAGVWRYAAALPQPHEQPRSMLKSLPGDVGDLFRNPSFRILFTAMLLFVSGVGLNQALGTHVAVFVWKLRPESIQVLTYALLVGITAGIPLTPLLLRRMEKRTAVLLGFVLVMIAWLVLPILYVTGVFRPEGETALTALSVATLIAGVGTGVIYIAFPSMMADAADEHEHRFGVRREGLYFSGLGFAGKAAAGVGTLVGGVALDVLNFPREAGRQVDAVLGEDVLSGLLLASGPLPAALAVVGALIFAPYAITRARHAAVLADLRFRRMKAEASAT